MVPSVGHYAILENDETVAEITIGETRTQITVKLYREGVLTSLIEKIQEHGRVTNRIAFPLGLGS